MPISNPVERQYPLVARVDFIFSDFGATGVAEPAITLPVNSIVTGGQLIVSTEFDSGNSDDTLEIGDASSPARYLAAVDADTAVSTNALVPTGFITTGSEPSIEIEWTGTGAAAAAGAGYLEVEYVIVGRGNEAQP